MATNAEVATALLLGKAVEQLQVIGRQLTIANRLTFLSSNYRIESGKGAAATAIVADAIIAELFPAGFENEHLPDQPKWQDPSMGEDD